MRADARRLLAVALSLITFVGCGVRARGLLVSDDDETSPPETSSTSTSTAPASEPEAGATTVDVSADAATDAEPFMYVSTEATLYSFAPKSKTWKVLADLTAKCPYAYELAVDSKGVLYGASNTLRKIYEFDATFGCTQIPGPNSGDPWGWTLSFVPKNVFGAAADTIVGYAARDYYRVLPNGGTLLVTSNALDPQMQPSGDIVSMGDRAFVAVTGSAACSTKDCLLEIAPKDGTIVKNWGTFPGNEIWAIAHTAGKIYGFRSTGEVYEVTLADPLVVEVLPGPEPGTIFSGAGSSTAAPTQ